MIFTATIEFYGPEQGGRFTPPRTGYHPQLRVGQEQTSCIIMPQDKNIEAMDFGMEHAVTIQLMFEEIYRDKIAGGMDVELYEGSKLIGRGVITGNLKESQND